MVISAPRALQAVFAAMNDWFTWQLAVKIYGPGSNASIFTVRPVPSRPVPFPSLVSLHPFFLSLCCILFFIKKASHYENT
jgi:hypothetical protein